MSNNYDKIRLGILQKELEYFNICNTNMHREENKITVSDELLEWAFSDEEKLFYFKLFLLEKMYEIRGE